MLFSKQKLKFPQDQEGNYGLSLDEVVTIKKDLIGLMTSVPPNIQYQLGEAIGIIAESDFYERWDTLVDVSTAQPTWGGFDELIATQDLVSRLTPNNTVVNNGVLQVAHSIFKRWRPLMRSDDLFTEINHVLSRFGEPFLVQLQVRLQNLSPRPENRLIKILEHPQSYSRTSGCGPGTRRKDSLNAKLHNAQPANEAFLRFIISRSSTNLRR